MMDKPFAMPIGQWLLCVWQARQLQAPWWSVLLLVCAIAGLEQIAPERRHRAWPELVRVCVSLVICVFVISIVLGEQWRGRALVPILMLVCVLGLLDYKPNAHVCVMGSLLAVLVGVGCVLWGPERKGMPLVSGWLGWVQLALALQALLVGNNAQQHAWAPWVRLSSGVGVCLVVLVCPQQRIETESAWVLLLLPCICMLEKILISACIVPIVETLLPIAVGGSKQTKVQNMLLRQQHQEILFYIVAWSVALGLGSRTMPNLLLGVLLVGGLMSLRLKHHVAPQSVEPRAQQQHVIKIHANFLSHGPLV